MSAFIYARRTFSSERENMELLDLRFSEKTLKILKGMAGQVFEKYRCDPSIFHPVYLLPVGIYAGGKCYIMTQEMTGRATGGKRRMFWNGSSVKRKKRNPLEPPCRGAGRSCPSKRNKRSADHQ